MIRRALYFLFFFILSSFHHAAASKPHVLFISIDDLRPELGCYGKTQIKSPHIDRLAEEGVLFKRAYCQVPTCGASRASLFSGLRPTPNRFLTAKSSVDEEAGDVIDLAGYFKQHGYYTVSNGKIHHSPKDRADSWDEVFRPNGYMQYQTPENIEIAKNNKWGAACWEAPDVEDNALQGGKIADKVIEDLRKAKESGQPSFITVGLTKPHLPFIAPKKYWDLYSEEDIKMAPNPFAPKNAPKISLHNSRELRLFYTDVPEKGPIPEEIIPKLIHGYYACVSFSDAMVGRILDELDRLEMRDETIVILWGDHGWQLGEHDMWVKHCVYNTSLNAPLIISAPGMQQDKIANGLVEFVDIYPTLCDLAGIGLPDHLQGASVKPMLEDASHPGKRAVFSRFRLGDTVRTDRYMYSEWMENGEIIARMLYDHEVDPWENENVAEYPEFSDVVSNHSKLLAEHRDTFFE